MIRCPHPLKQLKFDQSRDHLKPGFFSASSHRGKSLGTRLISGRMPLNATYGESLVHFA